MAVSWIKSLARGMFRRYLSKFPLRDGKAYWYGRLHPYLLPPERFITVRLDLGFVMKLDLGDPEQLKIYFYGHYHERYEADLVRRLLGNEEVFWDIGANVGYFTLVAATALQNRGQIIALEPGGNAYARLCDNLALNRFDQVRTYQLAAADTAGEARLYLAGGVADSGASLFDHGQDGYEVVRTVALDDLLASQGLRPPDLIKMDVEGAELAVLKGAARLLSGFSPLLLLEMEDKTLAAAGATKGAIQQLLSGYGYRPAFLRRGRWYLTDDVQGVKGRNIFWFIPHLPAHREKAARLPVRGISSV